MKNHLINCDEIKNSCLIDILHSSINTADQKLALCAAEKLKILLTSNIAESSVTIPNVGVVIDFCRTKYNQIDENSNVTNFVTSKASKDNLKQRKGRTGRTCDGIVYRLIFEEDFDQLPDHEIPEILHSPEILHLERRTKNHVGTLLSV